MPRSVYGRGVHIIVRNSGKCGVIHHQRSRIETDIRNKTEPNIIVYSQHHAERNICPDASDNRYDEHKQISIINQTTQFAFVFLAKIRAKTSRNCRDRNIAERIDKRIHKQVG